MIIQLASAANPNMKFHPRSSSSPGTFSCGRAVAGIALSATVEVRLLSDQQSMCAVRLRGSCRTHQASGRPRALSVVVAFALIYSRSDTIDTCASFSRNSHKSHALILILDPNVQAGHISLSRTNLGRRFGVNSCRSDNG